MKVFAIVWSICIVFFAVSNANWQISRIQTPLWLLWRSKRRWQNKCWQKIKCVGVQVVVHFTKEMVKNEWIEKHRVTCMVNRVDWSKYMGGVYCQVGNRGEDELVLSANSSQHLCFPEDHFHICPHPSTLLPHHQPPSSPLMLRPPSQPDPPTSCTPTLM